MLPVVLKIGGSLITDKTQESVFQPVVARRLAEEIAAPRQPVLVVHGAGSFGKPPAQRFGYLDGFLSRRRTVVVTHVEELLEDLRHRFLQILRSARVPAYGLSPAALFGVSEGNLRCRDVEPVRELLERGLCPVVSGGIVPDQKRDFAVLSSDYIAAAIAANLPAQRLIFATDVPGLMPPGPDRAEPVPVVHEREDGVRSWLHDASQDVSAGMEGKLAAGFFAARAGVEVQIVDGRVPDRVRQALGGAAVVATRLVAAPARRVARMIPEEHESNTLRLGAATRASSRSHQDS
jgi:glutamate 5-kinase